MVYLNKIRSYGFWEKIFVDFNVFYDADSPATSSYILEPFQSVAFRHPLRDFYLYPFHLLSRWVPVEILLILASAISLIILIFALGKSTQLIQNLFFESKLYLIIPLLSTCTLTWLFVPESFLISGAMIFAAIVLAAHTKNRGWLLFSGFLASGMNILGFIPWMIVILLKRNLGLIHRMIVSTIVIASESVWIIFGKFFLDNDSYGSVSVPSIGQEYMEPNLAPSSTLAFLHSPVDYWQQALTNYLTVPWISAFGNSNPRVLLPLLFIILSVALSILSFYGLIIGIGSETKLRLIAASLIIFDLCLLPVFLCFGFAHDGFLFAPLILPGRILGLLLSLTEFRSIIFRIVASFSVPILALATILSDIYI